ncbi:hypothetical protein BBJ28_00001175 [Nothophytophthora sp. Chile5]|nr:hypothetical protein BBJ28_00001175 [Nothophytophthora sp. Chile5]
MLSFTRCLPSESSFIYVAGRIVEGMTENEATAANAAKRDASAGVTCAKTAEVAQEPQEHGGGETACVQPKAVASKEPQTPEPPADTDATAPDARTCNQCKLTFTTAEQRQTHVCGATTDTRQGPDPQETEQSGDENAQALQTRACTKCSKKFTTAELLQAHLCGAPEMTEHSHDKKADAKARTLKARTCTKCGKTFSAPQGLRTHLSNVYPCDQPRPPLQMRTPKPVSKTCPKCGKSFTQWQGLRTHLNRVFPCDQEKPPSAASIAEKKNKAKAYTKGGNMFTAQGYKTLVKRSGPCNEERQELAVSEEDVKDLELKEKVRLFARRAYLRRIGRLHERDEPTPHPEDANENVASMPATSSMDGNRKRSAEDAGEPLEPSGTEGKRPRGDCDTQVNACGDVGAVANLATLNQESDRLDSSKLSPVSLSKWASTTNDGGESVGVPTVYPHSAYSTTEEHGGNLLDGGCSCAPCVRSWATKLLVRMRLLEKEITRLRQQVASDDDSEQATDANATTNSSTIQSQAAPPAAARQSESDVRAGILSPHMQPPCSACPSAENTSMISDPTVTSDGGAAAAVIVNDTAEKGGGRQEGAQRLEPAQTLSPSQSPQPEETRADEAQSVVVAASGETEKVAAEHLHPIVAEVVPNVVQLANANQSTGLSVSANHDEERGIPLHLSDAATKKFLVDEYARVNDEIILNERAVEDSLQHVDAMMNFDKATVMELRSQIEELRVSINNEKHKRDSAVAALIAHDWATRSTALQIAMKRMEEVDASSAILHKRCADIASQLESTKEVLAALGDRIELLNESGNDSRGRYAELGALSSKFAAEQYAKGRLESECEEAFMELLKASRQIRVMTRRKLLEGGAQG